MTIGENQMPPGLRDIIDSACRGFASPVVIETRESIPSTQNIPLDNPQTWLKIEGVNCVFVDMKGSTQLSATHHDRGTASIYRLFTQTAIKIFAKLDAAYIDVKGDGAFALFDSNHVHRALVSAVSFHTFAKEVFTPKVLEKTGLEVGHHVGIDQSTLLVRKMGMRMTGRTDRQNEVWAGKAVNMAAKLGSIANSEIAVSDRYHRKLTARHATLSCGCNTDSVPAPLWRKQDVSDDPRFNFDTAFMLPSVWCRIHGSAYQHSLLQADV